MQCKQYIDWKIKYQMFITWYKTKQKTGGLKKTK